MRFIAAALLIATGNEFSCSAPPTAVVMSSCASTKVTVVVSTGPVPIYSWSPSCGVSFLMVQTDGGGSALWTVYGNSTTDNPIGSGVRYGLTPAEARTVAGPEPLRSGVTYRVVVSRLVCESAGPCTLELAGDAQFRF
jgi:hypothetical protein